MEQWSLPRDHCWLEESQRKKTYYKSCLLFAPIEVELGPKFPFCLASSFIGKYHFNRPYDFAKVVPKALSDRMSRECRDHRELNCCA